MFTAQRQKATSTQIVSVYEKKTCWCGGAAIKTHLSQFKHHNPTKTLLSPPLNCSWFCSLDTCDVSVVKVPAEGAVHYLWWQKSSQCSFSCCLFCNWLTIHSNESFIVLIKVLILLFWLRGCQADLNYNVQDDPAAFYGVTSQYESSENMTITCSTKVCSFGKQVVEKVEVSVVWNLILQSDGRRT